MRSLIKSLTSYFLVYFFLLVLWSFSLHIAEQKDTIFNYLFNVGYAFIYLAGGVLAFWGTKLTGFHNSTGKHLASIGIGMIGFAIGLFIWSYYNIILNIKVPYPSYADMFFILYIPFLAAGIINLLRLFGVFVDKKIYFESSIIFLFFIVFVFMIGNPPDLSSNTPVFERSFNIMYLLGDSFLISLGYMLIRLTRGKIHKSFIYFMCALFTMAFADLLFSYRIADGSYWNGGFSDILYALSGLFFSLGVIKIIATQYKIKSTFQ